MKRLKLSICFIGILLIFLIGSYFLSNKYIEAAETDWVVVGTAGFSEGGPHYISVAIDSNRTPYVAFKDIGFAAANKATVMKFNGKSWELVGNRGFSTGGAPQISIVFDSNDTPYVAYMDEGITTNATVMKYDKSSWVPVGAGIVSEGEVGPVSIAMYNDIPYVAYQDATLDNKITVKKFDGNSWVNIGLPNVSVGNAQWPSIAIDSNSAPYVVYRDDNDNNNITVRKYNGTEWINVGSRSFSTGAIDYPSIAIDSNDTPYVAFNNQVMEGMEGKATVMKYTGAGMTGWELIGNAGFSTGKASSLYSGIEIAIDSNDIPYVAYPDEGNGGKPTVMKYDGSSWVPVGTGILSEGRTFFVSLVFNNGVFYTAFEDQVNSGKATVMKYGEVADSPKSFRPTGPLVPTITTYIPTPLDISIDPSVIATNIITAIIVMIFFAVATGLFTRTLSENEEFINRIIKRKRFFIYIGRLKKRIKSTIDTLMYRHSIVGNVFQLISVILFYGLVYSLLDHTWNPFSLNGLVLFTYMTVAYGIVGIADDIMQWRALKKWKVHAELSVRPTNLFISLFSILSTRLLEIVPGIMFGSPQALRVDQSKLDKVKLSRLPIISITTFFFIGFGLWLLTIATSLIQQRPSLTNNIANAVSGLESFLLLVFAVAIQNTFVQILGFPGGFGQALRRKNRLLWFFASTAITFAFIHTLINPEGKITKVLENNSVKLFIGIVGIYVIIAFGLWLFFKIKKPSQS